MAFHCSISTAYGQPLAQPPRCTRQAGDRRNEWHRLHLGARSTPARCLLATLTRVRWLQPGLRLSQSTARGVLSLPASQANQPRRGWGAGTAPTRHRRGRGAAETALCPTAGVHAGALALTVQHAPGHCHGHTAWLHHSFAPRTVRLQDGAGHRSREHQSISRAAPF